MPGYIIVLAIGGVAGVLVGLIVTVLSNKPLRQLRRAEKEFQRAIRPCCPTAKVFSFGGKHVHPDIWIATVTDAERDKLQQDTNLIHQLRAALLHVGYPAEDVAMVQLVLESQEAVDREFEGSWSQRRNDWHKNRF